jgi:hypothetical protein
VQSTPRDANSELRPGTGKGAISGEDSSSVTCGRQWASSGRLLRLQQSSRQNPPRHAPRQQLQDGGKTDVLSSANGPSTSSCSKDVTVHQHLLGDSPGRPCPVPACIWQPTPGQRRLSSPLRNRIFCEKTRHTMYARFYPARQDREITSKSIRVGICIVTWC